MKKTAEQLRAMARRAQMRCHALEARALTLEPSPVMTAEFYFGLARDYRDMALNIEKTIKQPDQHVPEPEPNDVPF